jgi:hypothetical protein
MTTSAQKRWSSRPAVKPSPISSSVQANRAALKKLSKCELICGRTVEQLDEFHRREREHVYAGIRKAA